MKSFKTFFLLTLFFIIGMVSYSREVNLSKLKLKDIDGQTYSFTDTKNEKYVRLKTFSEKLPLLTSFIDNKLRGTIYLNDKEYIIALLFKILLKTHSRVGNEIYADENNTYGLTTLLKKHIKISESQKSK